jgi:hypothetical protein
MMAPACFATSDSDAESGVLKIESSTPADGAKDVSVENLSVKLQFNKDMKPATDAVKKANAKQFKLTSADGEEVPIKVYYSSDEEGLVMVASNVRKSGYKFDSNADYTLTIGSNLQATDGSTLGTEQTITFTTINQKQSTMVYTGMMLLMVVGMIFFSVKGTQKMAEKQEAESGKSTTVNPYKEAKRTGKSVEEIVAKDQKKKAKQAEAAAKKQAAAEELEKEILEKMRKENNKRVSTKRPISEAGSTYKVKVVKTQKAKQNQNKSNTNPKNQTGKQKNSKNKNKGKKK